MSRTRVACGVSALVAMLAACASVADLDVNYEPVKNGEDGGGSGDAGSDGTTTIPPRGPVRPSTAPDVIVPPPPPLETTTLGSCGGGDLDTGGYDAGCDTAAGLGCCLTAGGNGTCMDQHNIASCGKTGPARYVGCRQSVDDITCCWRDIGSVRVALPCTDGGVRACLNDVECAVGERCKKASCTSLGIEFGECGTGADLTCP